MIKLIRLMQQERKANKRRKGWDYAAGRILEDGEIGVRILQSQTDRARDFGDYNDFDEGITNAIRKHRGNSYYRFDGRLMNADGTRSIFDDVDE